MWRSFSTSDGLASKKIEAVVQDRNGDLWVGTDEGLQKFSSSRPWPIFLKKSVFTLLADDAGIVWVGTDSGLYSVERNGGVESFPFPDDKTRKVYSVWRSPDGGIWCGTDDGVWVLREHTWSRLRGLPKGAPVFSVCSIDKIPLAGTRGALYGYRDGSWKSFSVPVLPANATISSILVAGNGDIWLGTDKGIVLHAASGDWKKPIELDGIPEGSKAWIWKLLEDDDGSIWVATDGYGVYHLKDGKIVEHLTSSSGLSSSSVKDILKDSEGGLWFATAAGLDRYDRYTWSYYVSERRKGSIISGTRTPDGTLWVASYRVGVWKFNGRGWERCYPRKWSLSVTAVAAAPDGNVWVGTEESGIMEISPNCKLLSKQFTVNGASIGVVNALAVAPNGDLWVGTHYGVLHRSGKKWVLYTPTDYGAKTSSVRSLAIDKGGRVWIGTDDGTLEMFDGEWHRAQIPKSAGVSESKGIWSIAFSRNGGIWLGLLDGGASYFDGKTWKHYCDDVLPSKDVFSIYVAPDGEVWIGTNGGVGRFDGKVWLTYTREDGLPDNEVTWIGGGKGGSVWFGNPSGVLFRYRRGKTPPEVSIESVNGSTRFENPEIISASGPLSIVFRGIDTKTPSSSLYYRYILKGLESRWHVVKDERHVDYGSLPPGRYEFVVQAIDGDLLYSEPSRLAIVVQPAAGAVSIFGVRLPKSAAVAFLVMGALLVLFTVHFVASEGLKKGKVAAAIRRHFNPYIAGTPVSDERMFFGREDILKSLMSTVHRNNVMILGERRIGKTSLLQYLTKKMKEADDPEYFFVPLYIDLEGISEERFFHFLAEEIYSGLKSGGYSVPSEGDLLVFRKDYKHYNDRDFRKDLKAIISALKEDAGEKHLRLILLLDEVDVMGSYSSQTQQLVRRLFMESFAQYLGMVVAGVRINKAWDRVESPWYNMFTQIELAPLKKEEAERLIREPVEGIYAFDNDAVEFIWEQSKGKPFYIQQLCMEAVNTMLQDKGKKGRITLKHVTKAYNKLVSTDKSLSARV